MISLGGQWLYQTITLYWPLCYVGCNKADLIDQSGTVKPVRCADRRFVSGSSISDGMVCYNGTNAGSRAVYICNDGYSLMDRNKDTRVCQSDGNWNGSILQCIQEKPGTYCNQLHILQC